MCCRTLLERRHSYTLRRPGIRPGEMSALVLRHKYQEQVRNKREDEESSRASASVRPKRVVGRVRLGLRPLRRICRRRHDGMYEPAGSSCFFVSLVHRLPCKAESPRVKNAFIKKKVYLCFPRSSRSTRCVTPPLVSPSLRSAIISWFVRLSWFVCLTVVHGLVTSSWMKFPGK